MLNPDLIRQEIEALSWSFGAPTMAIHSFESLPSTNDQLWELLSAGEQIPVMAIAQQQTAGRGQWGRQWQSSPGGLYLSLGLTITPDQLSPLLTFASAWGIATTLQQAEIPVQLKWPNDLILQGRKLGGIKLETRSSCPHIVIGVGINWQNQPPFPGISLETFFQRQGKRYISHLEQLAALTTSGILTGYDFYAHQGCDRLLQAYEGLLIHLNQEVKINGSLGTILGVNQQGELRIRLKSPGASSEIRCPLGTISLGYDLPNLNPSQLP
ncbi:biotin--[acetyl-CoA-carboxylase] ligase [Spirulina subsalsa FACHB-351]|uniref:Biotin--[acetyl-CoA-carboxylase] ligase n=1 Tax=Spirulina subsalsa FACHB-351 TaxID=234711 RepID=A0ABT3L569_9CYAN|nr:biotin--[acetyl-CoA-carboxylase] ligase [Spirulina subsalsa]MCW6036663.1 biotin--[acetyl-CoA-carboxylase] ligase [Spirulina subsalsa FACHB-351]